MPQLTGFAAQRWVLGWKDAAKLLGPDPLQTMKFHAPTAVLAGALALPFLGGGSGTVGGTMPEFEALKWYNTPPLSIEDLKDKAVLIEVFRTW